MNRNRVVLADDHPDVLREIRELLTPDFQVLGAATDGVELIHAARACGPDVVISDIRMPRLNGLEACRRILQERLSSAAIILTMYDDRTLLHQAIDAGIQGFVLKVDAGGELIPALRSVLSGAAYFSSGVRRR